MKKYFPFALVLIGILVIGGAFLLSKGKKPKNVDINDKESFLDVKPEEMPIVSLTPTSDGHYLKLRIEKIVIPASLLDYELFYKTTQGVTQGVPGTVYVEGLSEFEVDLLLGSESSGKFRYDEGVEEGSLSLRFRDQDGKLLANFLTDFHLQSNTDNLTSLDGNFEFSVKPSSAFFVVMHTVGYPGEKLDIAQGPYGVFSSEANKVGVPKLGNLKILRWNEGKWLSVEKEASEGIFVGVN